MSNGRRYNLTVETPHWGDEADSIRRLRALLKRLGRGYGVRCLDVRPAEQPPIPNPDGEYSYLLEPSQPKSRRSPAVGLRSTQPAAAGDVTN